MHRLAFLFSFFLSLSLWLSYGSCIYFFLDPGQKRCFVEQMPKHTVYLGNFSAAVYSNNRYVQDPNLKLQISVESRNEIVMNQLASSTGRFFFTSAESAEHIICLSAVIGSWMGNQRVKTDFEVFIGDPGETSITSPIEAKLTGLAQKIQKLSQMVVDIRRDQYHHRVREAEFRDKSEYVNGHVVWWMMVQFIILAITCLWQLKHLERFFRTKKLV